jgi:hypothetical protein
MEKVECQERPAGLIAKYDGFALSDDVEEVVVAGTVSLDGVPVSGCYSVRGRRAYVACRAGHQLDELEFEQVIHSEISSLLLARHIKLFNSKAWEDCVSSGVRSQQSGLDAIRGGSGSCIPDRRLWDLGFLYPYAMANTEEDFNSVAEQLWSGTFLFSPEVNPGLSRLFPRLARKGDLAISFYQALSRRWDSQFFSRLLPAGRAGR